MHVQGGIAVPLEPVGDDAEPRYVGRYSGSLQSDPEARASDLIIDLGTGS